MPATKANALTALKVKALSIPGVYTGGNGLTLRVDRSEAKRGVGWLPRRKPCRSQRRRHCQPPTIQDRAGRDSGK